MAWPIPLWGLPDEHSTLVGWCTCIAGPLIIDNLLIILIFLEAVPFIVSSGHGGVQAAEYVKQNLFSNLIEDPKFISDTKSAIGSAPSISVCIFC